MIDMIAITLLAVMFGVVVVSAIGAVQLVCDRHRLHDR